MKLNSLFEQKKIVYSFEVFPPKKTSSIQTIYDTLEELVDLSPDFISVTYGAGGNPADRSTVEIASTIKHKYHIEPLAHLTCVNSTREHIGQVLDDLRQNDIENILALRGDINPNVPPQTDYYYAGDLIRELHSHGDFDIAAACYPEVHPECPDMEEDILHLKERCGISCERTGAIGSMNDYVGIVLFQRRQKIAVPAKENFISFCHSKTGAVTSRRNGVHTEQCRLQKLHITVLSCGQALQFFQKSGIILTIHRKAGFCIFHPFPCDRKRDVIQNFYSGLPQQRTPLLSRLIMVAL